jgi:hypothetical protein
MREVPLAAASLPPTPNPTLDWNTPIKHPFEGPEWVVWCVEHYEHLLWMMQQRVLQDEMGRRDWDSACAVLDMKPEPHTIEEANKRWRAFVGAVWMTMERYVQRQRRARLALVQRRRGKARQEVGDGKGRKGQRKGPGGASR